MSNLVHLPTYRERKHRQSATETTLLHYIEPDGSLVVVEVNADLETVRTWDLGAVDAEVLIEGLARLVGEARLARAADRAEGVER